METACVGWMMEFNGARARTGQKAPWSEWELIKAKQEDLDWSMVKSSQIKVNEQYTRIKAKETPKEADAMEIGGTHEKN